MDLVDVNDRRRVLCEGYRIVRNPKRRRKLQKRGESVWWSSYWHAWIWRPEPCEEPFTDTAFCPICGEESLTVWLDDCGMAFTGEYGTHWVEGFGKCSECGWFGEWADSGP